MTHAAATPSREYLAAEYSDNVRRTGTLFPIALARWRHHTQDETFAQLVHRAATSFAAVLEGQVDAPPFQYGPADVAAFLTIIAERRLALPLMERDV